ncbi:MAG: molybdopterin-guanine dinucleotide biosynthesis protein B [Chloroflexota bacterium]|nr:molybdopterin-guanine dinucleotide biosynthesis protein B [Chloroflexota bacterium]
MIPIISIVGRSKVGKTSFLEGLIPVLKSRGYRLAVIKHAKHGFEMDSEGTDSWRLTNVGADICCVTSPQKMVMIKPFKSDSSLHDVLNTIGQDIDIVITEGYKEENAPKIEVHRRDMGELICSSDELIAIITDEPLLTTTPQLTLTDFSMAADIIEREFLDRSSNNGT